MTIKLLADRKKLSFYMLIILFFIVLLTFICDMVITHSAKGFISANSDKVPYNKAGLLLGTSKLRANGKINSYYMNRIYATVILYRKHKIDFIVISGDNRKRTYNEPEDMKNDLMKYGIPANRIYLDYAGFRTLDSIIRMDKIFGQKRFTIISQKFHNQRALYIAHHYKLNPIAYNAGEVKAYYGFKTKLREKLARVKLFIDILTHKQPKFLGEKIVLGLH